MVQLQWQLGRQHNYSLDSRHQMLWWLLLAVAEQSLQERCPLLQRWDGDSGHHNGVSKICTDLLQAAVD
jgi:hypothetical protein